MQGAYTSPLLSFQRLHCPSLLGPFSLERLQLASSQHEDPATVGGKRRQHGRRADVSVAAPGAVFTAAQLGFVVFSIVVVMLLKQRVVLNMRKETSRAKINRQSSRERQNARNCLMHASKRSVHIPDPSTANSSNESSTKSSKSPQTCAQNTPNFTILPLPLRNHSDPRQTAPRTASKHQLHDFCVPNTAVPPANSTKHSKAPPIHRQNARTTSPYRFRHSRARKNFKFIDRRRPAHSHSPLRHIVPGPQGPRVQTDRHPFVLPFIKSRIIS